MDIGAEIPEPIKNGIYNAKNQTEETHEYTVACEREKFNPEK